MISPDILDFLRELRKNNNREWFENNKENYLRAKMNFDNIVVELIQLVKSIDPETGLLEPKDCTFRIYRDVRFSKDKSPYKTNFGAYINRGGKNSGFAGYYFHIEPGSVFLSGGIYMPEAPVLKAIRDAIFDAPEVFKAILENPSFKKYFKGLSGEKLKTVPRAYPRDHPDAELLKFKNYYVDRPLRESILYTPGIFTEIRNTFKELKKLNDFLNRAIEHVIIG